MLKLTLTEVETGKVVLTKEFDRGILVTGRQGKIEIEHAWWAPNLEIAKRRLERLYLAELVDMITNLSPETLADLLEKAKLEAIKLSKLVQA